MEKVRGLSERKESCDKGRYGEVFNCLWSGLYSQETTRPQTLHWATGSGSFSIKANKTVQTKDVYIGFLMVQKHKCLLVLTRKYSYSLSGNDGGPWLRRFVKRNGRFWSIGWTRCLDVHHSAAGWSQTVSYLFHPPNHSPLTLQHYSVVFIAFKNCCLI